MADIRMTSPSCSLADLLGEAYIDCVCAARSFVENTNVKKLRAVGHEKVDFYPAAFSKRVDDLLPLVGTRICAGLPQSARGASTRAFREASRTGPAPLTGMGYLRVGEDGRLYFASKAEHYHLSLGHSFPGFRLIELARRLGIPNSTHNNTRGHVTRLAEEAIVAAANGVSPLHREALDRVLGSEDPRTLNRIINLETGSLAVEAALKMVLARFYRFDSTGPEPRYAERVPVVLVVGDREGGISANYHGTSTLTQVMRGLWPGIAEKLESGRALLVRPVAINDIADFETALSRWDSPPYKVAGFFHEIVLMNYGAILLKQGFLRRAYELCRERDVPIVADEIQSCIWSPEVFMFREYGLSPDMVSIGKGFPGGEYPASRVLATPSMDGLQQFGALVTNGQEELASLAYLVTVEFTRTNAAWVREVGDLYERELNTLVLRYPLLLEKREGRRHLASLFFRRPENAKAFSAALNSAGIDISVQSYKAYGPPSCLTKLPLTVTPRAIEYLVGKMSAVLESL